MAQAPGYYGPAYLRLVGELLAPVKQRSYEAMRIAPGDRVLDVGCGTGIDTVELARRVGPAGEVAGVDGDARMVAAADERAKSGNAPARIAHRVADAGALPFPAASFDSSRSERVFQHLADPAKALAEMRRVTRPGGRIVVLDTDWGSASLDIAELELERRLLRFLAERMHRNGYAGRGLLRLFREAGLAELAYEAFTVPVVGAGLVRAVLDADRLEAEALAARALDASELGRWRAAFERADAAGGPFFCATLVLVSGSPKGS